MSAPLPSGSFDVIYADPPWEYDFSRSKSRSIGAHYQTMALEEIMALPVRRIAAEDAVLFLWVPPPKLPEGLAVVAAWGFVYKSDWIWDKERVGPGYWARNVHEEILIGTRGSPRIPTKDRRFDSVIRGLPRTTHSAKPPEVRRRIEKALPWATRRLELFARGRASSGWTFWGDQAVAEPGPGRPREYHFDPAAARALRARGLSWRAICDELHLPPNAIRSVSRACSNTGLNGVANPQDGGFATESERGAGP